MIGSENRGARLLDMYDRFNKGAILTKAELAAAYGVTEKTVQRDIDDLRAYLAESRMYSGSASIEWNPKQRGYILVHSQYEHLNNQEILALCKILLESRAFETGELQSMLDKLIAECEPESRDMVRNMIRSETFCYIPLHHGRKLLNLLWQLSIFISDKKIVDFTYRRQDGLVKHREVKPVAILFSEFYFYLLAFTVEKELPYPRTFRVDRIRDIQSTGKTFRIPYGERFSEGEFRKRVQFMYAGPLHTIQFIYKGPSIEAVLDRLPTAKVLSQKDGVYTLEAEAYGSGIDMWLKSQGDKVEILGHQSE